MNNNISNNDNAFQSIDETKEVFEKLEETKEEDISANLFVTGLPDWDLEPLYEVVKRRDN